MSDIFTLHKLSINNKRIIEVSKNCGCFHCLKIFNSSEIKKWVIDSKDYTAICPYCGIDSVIGDSNLKLNKRMLKEMNTFFFSNKKILSIK